MSEFIYDKKNMQIIRISCIESIRIEKKEKEEEINLIIYTINGLCHYICFKDVQELKAFAEEKDYSRQELILPKEMSNFILKHAKTL